MRTRHGQVAVKRQRRNEHHEHVHDSPPLIARGPDGRTVRRPNR